MNPFLPLLITGLIASTAAWIAVFHRAQPAPADWREDWPEWLNNAVCILPTERSAD